MREKHLLQDRIELLGSVRHSDVQSVSNLSRDFIVTLTHR